MLEYFHHPQKKLLPSSSHSCFPTRPSPKALATAANVLPVSTDCLSWAVRINEVVQYVILYEWLLSRACRFHTKSLPLQGEPTIHLVLQPLLRQSTTSTGGRACGHGVQCMKLRILYGPPLLSPQAMLAYSWVLASVLD